MSDDSDDDFSARIWNSRQKPNNRISSSESESSVSPILNLKRKKVSGFLSDSSDSSGSSIVIRKKRLMRLSSESDDGSDSSDSIIIRKVKRSAIKFISDDEEDQEFRGFSSQWETDVSEDKKSNNENISSQSIKTNEINIDSDSSDGQSEKCPICLLPIQRQELGSPESCDHLFCAECILEWSKNMNTCPVDRQEYHLILVRKKINGKIIRQIPVSKPTPLDLTADPIFCEICGSGDREDRLLLCDGCDLGFHLECLTPPLQQVPSGSWFCNVCVDRSSLERDYEYIVMNAVAEGQEVFSSANFRRSRLIPRTRQSERIISQIMHNRSIRNETPATFMEPTSSTQRSSPTTTNHVNQERKRSKRRRRKTKRTRKRFRMVYEIDKDTGEIISKRKQVRRARRKRRNGQRRPIPTQKTVKKRLAQQLGMCPMKVPTQSIPEVRIQTNNSSIHNRRYQAGIPTLDLFGQRDDLDYFSASDEDINGPNFIVRRAPNQSDVAHFRRVSRRKQLIFSPPPIVSSSTDLLGSILDSQTKFHSKSTKFSLDNFGKFKMEMNKTINNNVNIKDINKLAKQTPYSGNNSNNNNGNRRMNQPSYSNNTSYQGNSSYYSDNFGPSSTSGNCSPVSNSEGNNIGASNYDQEMPQDYTQSTLSSYDRDADTDSLRRNEENSQEDSDIDIYSDIEDSVSTSKVEELGNMKPLNLSPVDVTNSMAGNGSDIDNENPDSDNDMVIDTEKIESAPQDAAREDSAVSSSEDTVVKSMSTTDASSVPHSTSEIQSEAIQSSFEKKRDDAEDDEDVFSEDGCPNFSIYSSESINLAKNTDIGLDQDQSVPGEMNVVSSTPVDETTRTSDVDDVCGTEHAYDPEIAYDPETTCSSEKGSEAPGQESEVEDVYDPERVYDTPEDTSDPEKSLPPNELKKSAVENEKNEQESNSYLISKLPKFKAENIPKASKLHENEPKKLTLYSDSEDEEIGKISNTFAAGDMSMMTEDVSEEERSYTPCLDEKASTEKGKGPDGLDTELISDDEKNNDFDESHEMKAASEGDALEINAREFEMDLIRPDDFEEGEIVDKNKGKINKQQNENTKRPEHQIESEPRISEKENENNNDETKVEDLKDKQQSFKKLSKNNKERNYRDKDRRSKSKEKKEKENMKSKKKNKRKEIERYDVRALIAVKPRRFKDEFGRDIRKSSSQSRSRSRSKSYTPKKSPARKISKKRLSSASIDTKRKNMSGSRRRSPSISRSRSRQRKRSSSKSRRRSRSKRKSKPSKDRSKRRKRERSVSRSNSPTRKRRKDWQNRYSRERRYSGEQNWTPSLSGTPEAEPPRHDTPSWTPPRVMESAAVDPRSLTVILQNDQNKKKRDKKRKSGKKRDIDKRNKRKRKEQTPIPSKEVFASGDNILVSVSFNKENETRERDVFTEKKKEADEREKKKKALRRKKKNQELSGVKPVAIIDLDRSPFRELTPSPKDIIVLSDDEHVQNSNINDTQDICDSSQQVASPENVPVYLTGPKTPPEPQVKFTLPSKQPLLRPLSSNPLHDPEEEEEDVQDDPTTDDREVCDISDSHKGPNTPPDPPNSPPSSPDAYDPFEPTKSRSPSPDPIEDDTVTEDTEKRNSMMNEIIEKNTTIPSLTPPISDIQPADSQSGIQIGRAGSKSPDQIGRSVQVSASKSILQSTPFSAGSTILTSSTPTPSSTGQARINILSSTILNNVSSTIPQRIVPPNVKLSPVKISPLKNIVKATPIKPMPNKTNVNASTPNKVKSRNVPQNGNESTEVISLDFDSPYSPGSSDYEDLFEPPPEVVTKKTLFKTKTLNVKEAPTNKPKSTFDALFGSPINKLKKTNADKSKSKKTKGTKIVGVKLDEDHLKILDELPNSAVEMQVKDKFLKKLNRQERVVEEVKLVLKPYYNKKKIDKEEYKDIMRRAVPKICHNKAGEINPTRIKDLIEAYVRKMRHAKPKVTSSSSYNPLKC